MSEMTRKINKYFEDATLSDINTLLSNLNLDEHLRQVFIMKYKERKDIYYIASITNCSKSKIDRDLLLIRKKLAKAIGDKTE